MAYNPNIYMPYGQQSYPQPMVQQPVNGLVSVTGIEGARAYQLPPNSAMPLFDAESDVLYLKTTDGAGFPTVKAFSFAPIESEQPQAGQVSREEFDSLLGRVDRIADNLSNLTAAVESSQPKTRARRATDGE